MHVFRSIKKRRAMRQMAELTDEQALESGTAAGTTA